MDKHTRKVNLHPPIVYSAEDIMLCLLQIPNTATEMKVNIEIRLFKEKQTPNTRTEA